MKVVEIQVGISGNKEEIEKLLLNKEFEIFYKVLTITDYFLPMNDNDLEHSTLKDRCKRLRYIEPLEKFYNDQHNYEKFIKQYDINECKRKEQELIKCGYRKIYTDEKTDFVYKYKNEDNMYFQIQDIKDNALIIAYDNKKYYHLPEYEQRELLINDVLKYGIEIIDTKDIDRFKGVGKVLTIEEIINKMNDVINSLKK